MTEFYIALMAWLGLGLGVFVTLGSPLLVGKKRDPYTIWEPVKQIVHLTMMLPLYGRLLGWW